MSTVSQITELPMPTLIAKLGLLFSEPTLMIGVFLFGFFCLNDKAYSRAFMLLLFTMIYNYYLKSIWQIPLKPPLEGWAFPSGHMSAGWVFWGWLTWHYKNKFFTLLFAVMMSLTAYGLNFHGYHEWVDIIGSIGFGTLTLFLFHWLNRIPAFKQNIFVVNVIVGALALLFLFLIPMPHQAKPHLWLAHGGLMGMAIGWLFLMQFKPASELKITHNLITLLICMAGMAGIHFMLSAVPEKITPQNFYFAKGFALTLWIVSSKRLMYPILARIKS